MKRLFRNGTLILTFAILGIAAAAQFVLPALYQSNLDRFAADLMEQNGTQLTYQETQTGLLGTSFTVNGVAIEDATNPAPLNIESLFFDVTMADYFQNLASLIQGRGIQRINLLTVSDAKLPLGEMGGQMEAQNIVVSRLDLPALQTLLENAANADQTGAVQVESLPFQSLDILDLNLRDERSIVTLDTLRFDTVEDRLYDVSIEALDSDITLEQGTLSFQLASLDVDDLYLPRFPQSITDIGDLDTEDPEDQDRILALQEEFLRAYVQLYVKSFRLKGLRAKSDLFFDFSIQEIAYDILDGRPGPQNIYLPFKTDAKIDDMTLTLGPIGVIALMAVSPALPTTLTINGSGTSEWDIDSGRYAVKSSFALDNLMSLAVDMDLTGISEQTFADYVEFSLASATQEELTAASLPESFQDIGIRAANLEVQDLGAIDVAYTIADAQGLPKDVAPALLKAQIAANANMLAAQMPQANEIADALGSFIDGSKTLRINLAPDEPVTLGELQGADQVQIEASAVDRLGFTIETK